MDIDTSIKNSEKPLIEATREILKIRSVKEEPLQGKPFGDGPARALNYALDLAKSFGLKTRNLDNYVGWAEWGEGNEMIGIIVHLDVVPEGSGWTYPPYGGEIHDGKIYGRGAIDDKGPAMAALFALKALKDAGVKFTKRVRIIFGTDEESGFKDIEYYHAHDEMPDMGFSPDADYPIINGEKGIMTFDIVSSFNTRSEEIGTRLLSLKGGNRPNMVPDFARAYILGDQELVKARLSDFLKQNDWNIKLYVEDGMCVIETQGISAHGSTPEKGKNAVMQLIRFLVKLDIIDSQKTFLQLLDEKIGLDTTGKKLGVDFNDEISGDLTLNVGLAEMDKKSGRITVNIRYPISNTKNDVLDNIAKNLGEKALIENIDNMDPHFVPEDNPIVQKLKKAYEKVVGKEAYCFSIGGGTYARLFKNAVAFGPRFPGEPEVAHEKDEYIKIDDLLLNLKIYAYVIQDLIK